MVVVVVVDMAVDTNNPTTDITSKATVTRRDPDTTDLKAMADTTSSAPERNPLSMVMLNRTAKFSTSAR